MRRNYDAYDRHESAGRCRISRLAMHRPHANVRNRPCPTCGRPNQLTAHEVSKGYQCRDCADREEFY